ncbi:MAG: hypothetical protein ACFCUJ_05265 [Thiotrichales bacterium]
MTEMIMAIAALASVLAFLGVVAWWVPHLDLIIVIAFVSLLASYDFWRTFRERKARRDGRGR